MGVVAKPCSRRRLLLAVAVLVVLVGSCCCADAEAAAAADYEQEQLSSKSKAGGSRRRRRSRRRAVAADAVTPAAPLMVPITILKSAVDSGAGMHACFSFNSFLLTFLSVIWYVFWTVQHSLRIGFRNRFGQDLSQILRI
jgi:hypothetical protein